MWKGCLLKPQENNSLTSHPIPIWMWLFPLHILSQNPSEEMQTLRKPIFQMDAISCESIKFQNNEWLQYINELAQSFLWKHDWAPVWVDLCSSSILCQVVQLQQRVIKTIWVEIKSSLELELFGYICRDGPSPVWFSTKKPQLIFNISSELEPDLSRLLCHIERERGICSWPKKKKIFTIHVLMSPIKLDYKWLSHLLGHYRKRIEIECGLINLENYNSLISTL